MMSCYDFVIVGAWIIGLTCAYEIILQKPHLRIAIIDKDLKEVERCFVNVFGNDNFDDEGNRKVSLSSLTKTTAVQNC